MSNVGWNTRKILSQSVSEILNITTNERILLWRKTRSRKRDLANYDGYQTKER